MDAHEEDDDDDEDEADSPSWRRGLHLCPACGLALRSSISLHRHIDRYATRSNAHALAASREHVARSVAVVTAATAWTAMHL